MIPGAPSAAALALTAIGVASAGSVRYAGDRDEIAFALAIALSLLVILLASLRVPARALTAIGFAAAAAVYLGAALGRGSIALALYVLAMALVLRATPAPDRALAAAVLALWTPALLLFGDVELPAVLAAAAALSLWTAVTLLVGLRHDGGRGRDVGLALLVLGAVATVADRHLVVASAGAAPDDLVALAAAAALPLALLLRRRRVRDLVTGLALAAYVLAAVALLVGKPYHSDAAVAVHRAAELLLEGTNPYRSLDLVEALARFGLPETFATHLEDGTALGTLNYPALSFLAVTPLVALGLPDVRWLYLAELVALALVLLRLGGPSSGALLAATVVGNAVVTRQHLLAGVDPAWAVLLALGVALMPHRTASAALVGLAAAARQPAWFCAPFYLLVVWRERGRREAFRRAAIAGGAFALPNLPFLLASPAHYLAGVLGPLFAPLEPHGVGLVRFGMEGVLPLLPRGAYAGLAAAAFAALLVLAWRRWPQLRSGTLALGLVPLYLAWRSLQSYFGFAGLFLALGETEPLGARKFTPEVAAADRSAPGRQR